MQHRSIFPSSLALALLAASLNGCATTGYAASSESTPATARTTPNGKTWTTAEGMSLYTFDKDSPGKSNCYDKCAQLWPPYLATEEAISDHFATIQRKDGSFQWALDDAPLYTWIKDVHPGDTNGHGVKNVWYMARADHVPTRAYSFGDALLLTDQKLMTLYTFDKDSQNQSNCNAACAAKWPPFMAASDAEDSPPYSVITRKDGNKQWTQDGQPLYYWIKDENPGDANGDGVKNLWHVVDLK
ncbi:MAG: hypothetical protein V3U76_11740 [Granulosicoccus sp.]